MAEPPAPATPGSWEHVRVRRPRATGWSTRRRRKLYAAFSWCLRAWLSRARRSRGSAGHAEAAAAVLDVAQSGPSALDCHATTWIERRVSTAQIRAAFFSPHVRRPSVHQHGCFSWLRGLGWQTPGGVRAAVPRSFPFPWSDLGEPGFCFSDNLCRGGAEGAGPGLLGRNLAAGFPLHRLADGPRPKHPRLGRGAGKCRRRCSDRSPAPDAGGWTPPRDRPAPFLLRPSRRGPGGAGCASGGAWGGPAAAARGGLGGGDSVRSYDALSAPPPTRQAGGATSRRLDRPGPFFTGGPGRRAPTTLYSR